MKKSMMGTIVCLLSVGFAVAQQQMRVRDLHAYLGQTVAVKGRTGNIVEAEEAPGIRVYTLRDDYGDVVHVRWRQDLNPRDDGYPIFGATYIITGQPTQAGNRIYLDETNRTRMYSPTEVFIKYGMPVVGIIVVGLLAVLAYARSGQRKLKLPPVWGYAEIVEGPQQGVKFALRGDETWIGRSTDPQRDICLSEEHDRVSRVHGRLLRQGGSLKYHDHGTDGTGSTYGSSIDGQPVPRGGTIDLPPGRTRINLGGQTTLLIVPAGALAESGTGMASRPTPPAERPDVHEEQTERADSGGPDNPDRNAHEGRTLE